MIFSENHTVFLCLFWYVFKKQRSLNNTVLVFIPLVRGILKNTYSKLGMINFYLKRNEDMINFIENKNP